MCQKSRSVPALAFVFAASAALGGCFVDQYGGRAVVYNLEAEQAQNQSLLLNVVRAYKRHPMQFTSLGLVQGQSTASTGITLNVPFGRHISSPDTLGLTSSVGGGINQFSITPLDSAEFYNALLTPVDQGTFDLYLQAGYPRTVLFHLFVDKIVVRRQDRACALRHTSDCELSFNNFVGSDADFDRFQALVEQLIRLGLTTHTPTAPVEASARSDDAKKDKKAGEVKKRAAPFCFAPQERLMGAAIDPRAICGSPLKPAAGVPLRAVVFTREFVDLLTDLQRPLSPSRQLNFDPFVGRPVAILIYSRPIQRIIYYLGEVTRRRLYPEYDVQRTIKVKIGPAHLPMPYRLCKENDGSIKLVEQDGYFCYDLFVLNAGSSGSPTFTVDYEGGRYSLPIDRDEAGYSYSTLTIARQLLATSISKDSLPPPSTTILTVGPR